MCLDFPIFSPMGSSAMLGIPGLMDIVRVLLSWAARVHSQEKSCQ